MEENKNKKQKQSNLNGSVILSFAVAVFAIFAIAMTGISMNQKTGVSYAAPTELPSSFTFKVDSAKIFVADSNNTTPYSVPIYFAKNGSLEERVFCVEKAVNPGDGYTYNSGDDITDNGLIYLLNNSFVNGVKVTDADGPYADYVETWVTQTAIWVYLYETVGGEPNEIKPDILSDIKTTKQLGLLDQTRDIQVDDIYTSSTKLYDKYIKNLVDNAKEAKETGNLVTLNVSKASDDISMTSDKKYYLSSLITVTGNPSSALKNYVVTLTGIEGATAIDENGNELPSTVTPGTKFYVRIPADKVTKDVQRVAVIVNGTFNTLGGKYYTAITGDWQKVVSVKSGERVVSHGTEVEFVGTDDTGMNTVQTIYFIGLIVLLCGVGIVYANAKPVQVKQ